MVDPGRLLANLRQQIAALFTLVFDHSLDALDVTDPERNNLPVLIEHRAQRVHQFRALVDNAFASAEQNRLAC